MIVGTPASLPSMACWDQTAAASITSSTISGHSSTLGWVRVVTMTCSPSLRSFGEMATARSCQSLGPDVHHIAGPDRDHARRAAHHQPALGVDVLRAAAQLLP